MEFVSQAPWHETKAEITSNLKALILPPLSGIVTDYCTPEIMTWPKIQKDISEVLNEFVLAPLSRIIMGYNSPPELINSYTRLWKELSTQETNPHPTIYMRPNYTEWDGTDKYLLWTATINGPQGTPYNGGTFLVSIQIPRNYPFKAPKTQFITKVYSMNLSEQGQHCLEIDKETWTPSKTIVNILEAIQNLLSTPDPNEPLQPQLATLYRTNPKLYEETAKNWTQKYAM